MTERINKHNQQETGPANSPEAKNSDFLIQIDRESENRLARQGVTFKGTKLKLPNSSQYHQAGTIDFASPHTMWKGVEFKPSLKSPDDVELTHYFREITPRNKFGHKFIISKGALWPNLEAIESDPKFDG